MSIIKPKQTFPELIPEIGETKHNHTFSFKTVVPSHRWIEINRNCLALYSTVSIFLFKEHKFPLAVHYIISEKTIQNKNNRQNAIKTNVNKISKRDQKFFKDSSFFYNIPQFLEDYQIGHFASVANYLGDQEFLNEVNVSANLFHQHKYCNGGIWRILENICRYQLKKISPADSVEIISGPILNNVIPFESNENQTQPKRYKKEHNLTDEDGIIIPSRLYKIIKINKKEESFVAAFVVNNCRENNEDRNLKSFEVSVREIELQTGLRFNLGKYKHLEEFERFELNKSIKELNSKFFEAKLSKAKKITEINNIKKSVEYYNCKTEKMSFEISEEQIEKEITMIEKSKSSNYIVLELLIVHKNLFEMGINLEPRDKRIREIIKKQIPHLLNNFYFKKIQELVSTNNQGYTYPFSEELKNKVFENAISSDSESEKEKKEEVLERSREKKNKIKSKSKESEKEKSKKEENNKEQKEYNEEKEMISSSF